MIEIGFSQRIRLEWMEKTAELVAEGRTKEEIKEYLDQMLIDSLSVGSSSKRGSRSKAISILLQTWAAPADRLQNLRRDGLNHLRHLLESDHLVVHWGMAMAAYPFFRVVAENAGRLLKLQGTVGAAQVQRRVREQLGERETVARAARRVLRTFTDWGVLRDTPRKGLYEAAEPRPVKDPNVRGWLVEAVLTSSGSRSGNLSEMTTSPCLFPFDLGPVNSHTLNGNPRLEIVRQGLDLDSE